MSLEHERKGQPWPAPNINGEPSGSATWWRGDSAAVEPFPLWPEEPAAGIAPDSEPTDAATSPGDAGAAPSPGDAGAAPSPGNAGAAPSPGNAGAAASPGNAGAAPSPGNAGAAASPGSASAGGPTEAQPRSDPQAAFRVLRPRGFRQVRVAPTPPSPVRPRRRGYRHPAVGLPLLVLFALLAGFFAWVSAEPFWLAIGHSHAGSATVTGCTGGGVTQRCLVTFEAAATRVERVTLVGVSGTPGTSYQAHMVDTDGRIAYVGSVNGLHLRWLTGLLLVALCGLGIAWGTGAARLAPQRARLAALGTSVAAPLALFVGMLIATW